MILVTHHRGKLWLRLKWFFTPDKASLKTASVNHIAAKPKCRSHRTTAFFEMP